MNAYVKLQFEKDVSRLDCKSCFVTPLLPYHPFAGRSMVISRLVSERIDARWQRPESTYLNCSSFFWGASKNKIRTECILHLVLQWKSTICPYESTMCMSPLSLCSNPWNKKVIVLPCPAKGLGNCKDTVPTNKDTENLQPCYKLS